MAKGRPSYAFAQKGYGAHSPSRAFRAIHLLPQAGEVKKCPRVSLLPPAGEGGAKRRMRAFLWLYAIALPTLVAAQNSKEISASLRRGVRIFGVLRVG